MDNKQFIQFKKKHTVVTKRFKVGMIAGCAALAVAGGSVAGHFAYKASHAIANNHEIVLDPTIETEVKITEVVTTKEGNKQCEVRSYEKEIVDIKVTIGGVLLTKDVDYTQEVINDGTVVSGYKVTVFRKTIDKYQGSINIVPKFNEGSSEELLKKIAELEEKIKAKEEEIAKAKETIATQEIEIAAKDKEILEKTAAIDQLKGDVAKLQAELEAAEAAYKAKLADLEAKHAAEMAKLKEEAQAAIEEAEKKGQEEVAKTKAKYEADIAALNEKHKQEIDALEQQFEAEKASYQAQIGVLEGQVNDLRTEKAILEAELADVQKDLVEAKTTLVEQKAQIEALNQQLEEAKAALEEAEKEAAKIVVMFADKDFNVVKTFKIACGSTISAEEVPAPTSGYKWKDFVAGTTKFTGHTLIHEELLEVKTVNIDYGPIFDESHGGAFESVDTSQKSFASNEELTFKIKFIAGVTEAQSIRLIDAEGETTFWSTTLSYTASDITITIPGSNINWSTITSGDTLIFGMDNE